MKTQAHFMGDIMDEEENSIDPNSATLHLDSN